MAHTARLERSGTCVADLMSMRLEKVLLVGVVALAGCGSQDSQSHAPRIELSGLYQAQGAGPISAIAFLDDAQYVLVDSPCTGATADCTHEGTYALNSQNDQLSLTDAATGKVTTMPFQVAEAAGLSTALSTLAASVTANQPLTTAPSTNSLVTQLKIGLVQFNAQQFHMDPGAERLLQHAANRAGASHCGDAVCFQKLSLDWVNAYWLARLSQFAYLNNADLTKALAGVGLKTDSDHLQFFDNTCTDTHAFYVTTADPPSGSSAPLTDPWNTASPDVAILAFRGTDSTSMLNIRTDVNAWPNHSGSSLGNVHQGFLAALNSVWTSSCNSGPDMRAYLAQRHVLTNAASPTRSGAELYVTGHSLGAALATVALAKTVTDPCDGLDPDCSQPYTPVSALYTFGSPRVGNTAFATALVGAVTDRTPLFRFVHDIPALGYDAVTTVPPLGLFRHLTEETDETEFEVFLQDTATAATISGVPSGAKPVALRSLADVKSVHAHRSLRRCGAAAARRPPGFDQVDAGITPTSGFSGLASVGGAVSGAAIAVRAAGSPVAIAVGAVRSEWRRSGLGWRDGERRSQRSGDC